MALPLSLSNRFRRHRIICFGCKEEGHVLLNCSNREKNMRRFQNFWDFGDAAVFILTHYTDEVDDSGHDVLTYFADDEAEVLHLYEECGDQADDTLDTWISQLFDVLDSSNQLSTLNQLSLHSTENMGQNFSAFVPLSLLELKNHVYYDGVLQCVSRSPPSS